MANRNSFHELPCHVYMLFHEMSVYAFAQFLTELFFCVCFVCWFFIVDFESSFCIMETN